MINSSEETFKIFFKSLASVDAAKFEIRFRQFEKMAFCQKNKLAQSMKMERKIVFYLQCLILFFHNSIHKPFVYNCTVVGVHFKTTEQIKFVVSDSNIISSNK